MPKSLTEEVIINYERLKTILGILFIYTLDDFFKL